ncbi:hypothetical protein [Emticicia oligotrophica]|uniref:hypothetical protein n=1 Tax=Emticicia oligotrophica TaxID=312279 RepID=UPI00273C5752|nr:hypothetical protein [Emticicia oligotrophica]
MIFENSGKIYRFKLDHNLGFGFAEIYDFTDTSPFDGIIIYVFDKIEKVEKTAYSINQIRDSKIALGPIRINKLPNVKGKLSWKFLFQNNSFLISELPKSKELRGLLNKNADWSKIDGWYTSDNQFANYEKIRPLETRILNHPSNVITKFSMKVLIRNNENISSYYDLNDLGIRNLYLQLVNTYYSKKDVEKLLTII